MSRRRRRDKRVASAIQQLPWQRLRNPYAPIEVLSADAIDTIIDKALTVLEQQGMRFLESGSRAFMRDMGAEVDDDDMMVRIPAALVREKCASTPSHFASEVFRVQLGPALLLVPQEGEHDGRAGVVLAPAVLLGRDAGPAPPEQGDVGDPEARGRAAGVDRSLDLHSFTTESSQRTW